MWIKSQDETILFNANHFKTIELNGYNNSIDALDATDETVILLGEYHSKERATEVFNKISCLLNRSTGEFVFTMPKE